MKLKKFLKFTVFSYDGMCEIRNEFDDFITRRAWRKIIDPSVCAFKTHGDAFIVCLSCVYVV